MSLKFSNASIRRALLLWLLLPLVVMWAINAIVSYPLAMRFSEDAFDRQLLNSADSIAARLKVFPDGRIVVDLPPAAQAIVRYNNKDKFYYQVVSGSGRNISGDAIPLPPKLIESPSLRYDTMNGLRVRVATIGITSMSGDDKGLVQVAETLTSRNEVAEQVLANILLPQLILMILGAAGVTFGIRRGLAPLTSLQHQIASRSQYDLAPIDESPAPDEVRPFVRSINALLGQLEEDIETQRRFVANAAHQLRTPLAGIKTYITLARRKNDDPTVSELLSHVDTGLTRMNHLVNKLLSLAKAEPESLAHKAATLLSLNELASEVTAELVSEAVQHSVELVLEADVEQCTIYGDGPAIKEMLSNIIENAIRYTAPGTTVAVRIKCSGDGGPVLEVADEGPGIPVQERSRVFERFYRIPDNEMDGAGLGLAIVREIAAVHRIRVEIDDNRSGRGAVFRLHFAPKHKESNSKSIFGSGDAAKTHLQRRSR